MTGPRTPDGPTRAAVKAGLCEGLSNKVIALRADLARAQAQTTELATECETLREALRSVQIGEVFGSFSGICHQCGRRWQRERGRPERHAPGCLAALPDRG